MIVEMHAGLSMRGALCICRCIGIDFRALSLLIVSSVTASADFGVLHGSEKGVVD